MCFMAESNQLSNLLPVHILYSILWYERAADLGSELLSVDPCAPNQLSVSP